MCVYGIVRRLKAKLSFLDEYLLNTESIRLKLKISNGGSLSYEESLRFRRLVRIELKALNFGYTLFKDYRKPLAKNISRLVRIFR